MQLCIKSRWGIKVPEALEFAVSLGRLKFVRPIFRALYAWEEMRERAISAYQSNKHTMMFMTRQAIAKDLHLA